MRKIFDGFISTSICELPQLEFARTLLNGCRVRPLLQNNLLPSICVSKRKKLNQPPDEIVDRELERSDFFHKGDPNRGPSESSSTCYNIYQDVAHVSSLMQIRLGAILGECPSPQGAFYYPMNGYRSWHTNRFDQQGWRAYFVTVDAHQTSFFRAMCPTSGKVHTIWDEPGRVNLFRIDPRNPIWHCIVADSAPRWSLGFLLRNQDIETLLMDK
tara:strand:- start:373 stop:1014 length:642 start_codon:yes stop_codon:yes gene_type:complete